MCRRARRPTGGHHPSTARTVLPFLLRRAAGHLAYAGEIACMENAPGPRGERRHFLESLSGSLSIYFF